MKKILYFAIAISIITIASCGNKQTIVDAEDHDTASVENGMDPDIAASQANQLAVTFNEKLNQHDKVAVNAIAREAESTIVKLLIQGDTASARSYAQQFRKFFSDNTEKIKAYSEGTIVHNLNRIARTSTLSEFIEEVDKTIQNDSTYQALKEFAKVAPTKEIVKAQVKTAAGQVVSEQAKPVVEKASETVNKVVTNAQGKVDEAKKKAAETKNSVDAAKEKLQSEKTKREEQIQKLLDE